MTRSCHRSRRRRRLRLPSGRPGRRPPKRQEPPQVDEVNVSGTLNLLDACRDEGIERFEMASSSSVYGKPQYLPGVGDFPRHPSRSRRVEARRRAVRLRLQRSVRPLYGSSSLFHRLRRPDAPELAISNFVSRCHNGEHTVIDGDGTQTRDFTYIGDVIDANMTLLMKTPPTGRP